MTETELQALCEAEIRESQGWIGKLSQQRARNLQYYFQEPMGTEQPGQSSVVSSDVSDTVEWILPSLVNVFCSSDDVVEFEPTSPEKEEMAQQATDYVNYILRHRSYSFVLFYNWFKDALVQKNGHVKSWFDRSECTSREDYTGLTDIELLTLLNPQAKGETITPIAGEKVMMPDGSLTYNVAIKRTETKGTIRILNVPPEEFLISKRAILKADGIDTPFAAHRTMKTVSDLRREGYRNVDQLQSVDYNDASWSLEKVVRYTQDSEMPFERVNAPLDPSMREVWIAECYIQVDFDGDGIAEWRKVTLAGNRVLDNEQCDGPPFSTWTPMLNPHRFFGRCPADLLIDLQQIKTALWRAGLNNAYLANNPRLKVMEGDYVNMDDVLTSRVGGIIRCKRMDAVDVLQMPNVMPDIQSMLDYTDKVRSARTGVMPWSMGLDPNALNDRTATEAAGLIQAATQRIALIARMFAETGLRDLAKRVLALAIRHQDKREVIKLRGQWVIFDPRTWDENMEVTVNVGLGTGSKDQTIAYLNLIGQSQNGLLKMGKGYMVSDANLYATAAKMAECAGFKNPEQFFTNPASPQGMQAKQQGQAQGPQDPKVISIMARQQGDQAKLQADAQKLAAQMGLEHDKLTAQQQEQLANIQAQLSMNQLDNETKLRIAAQQAETQRDVAQVKADDSMRGYLTDAMTKARADEHQAGVELAKIEAEDRRTAAELTIQRSEAGNR